MTDALYVPERVTLILSRTDAITGGTLTFGDDPTLPLFDLVENYYANLSDQPTEGVEYTLTAKLDGDLLMLTFAPSEVFGDWCALQQSYPAADGTYTCTDPSWDYQAWKDGGQMVTNDALCAGQFSAFTSPSACDCDADGCTSYSIPTREMDLIVDGDTMMGELLHSETGGISEVPEVRLRRVQ